MSNKVFWTKSLAFPTVAQVQVKHNSFAKYIHDILGMQFFPVLDFKQLANKDSSKSDDLKLALEQALDGDYDASGKGPPPTFPLSGGLFLSTRLPILTMMTMIHGLLSSFQLWLAFHSTMLECPLLFLARKM